MSDYEPFDEADLCDEDFDLLQETWPELKQRFPQCALPDAELKAVLYDCYFDVEEAAEQVASSMYLSSHVQIATAGCQAPGPLTGALTLAGRH